MSNVHETCAHKSGKQKTLDKHVNHVHVQCAYSRDSHALKSGIQETRATCNSYILHCVLQTMCINMHTKKQNIGNESSVLGKRLWVFSTKGEKLELPPTSKSLLPLASICFLSILRFLAASLFYFCLYFQHTNFRRIVEQKKFSTLLYQIDFVL